MPEPSQPRPIQNDPDSPMEINIVGQSPHVFAYRFWAREPGADEWKVIAEGHTADDEPDFHSTGPFPDQSRIAYWVGIGGNPETDYRAVVTFSQDGAVVHGGAEILTGRTSDKGGAVEEREVVLI
jgi:hypothetical protein